MPEPFDAFEADESLTEPEGNEASPPDEDPVTPAEVATLASLADQDIDTLPPRDFAPTDVVDMAMTPDAEIRSEGSQDTHETEAESAYDIAYESAYDSEPAVAAEVTLDKELEQIVARRSQHAPLAEVVEPSKTAVASSAALSDKSNNDDSELDSVSADSSLSFMRGVGRQSVWHTRWARWLLGALGLGLIATLAIQVTVRERDALFAQVPAARPWVSAVCEWTGCIVSPMRRKEFIVVESASFTPIRGDVYRLNFVIRNNAPTALAMPAVELALTDLQNRPVVRRVLLPAEFGGKSDALEPSAEWSSSLAVSVKTNGSSERIAGYRLLAFYP